MDQSRLIIRSIIMQAPDIIKNNNTLEYIALKACKSEWIPLPLFEKNEVCTLYADSCTYCRQRDGQYYCHKTTKVRKSEMSFA